MSNIPINPVVDNLAQHEKNVLGQVSQQFTHPTTLLSGQPLSTQQGLTGLTAQQQLSQQTGNILPVGQQPMLNQQPILGQQQVYGQQPILTGQQQFTTQQSTTTGIVGQQPLQQQTFSSYPISSTTTGQTYVNQPGYVASSGAHIISGTQPTIVTEQTRIHPVGQQYAYTQQQPIIGQQYVQQQHFTERVVQQPIISERIVSETDIYPERVEVMERHTYPNPLMQQKDLYTQTTEIEKEIVHVHPVRVEHEIVNVHPSLIEKEIIHVQPTTVHVRESVIHPEKVQREVEERMHESIIQHQQAQDILPVHLERKETQVYAQETLRENVVIQEQPTVYRENIVLREQPTVYRENVVLHEQPTVYRENVVLQSQPQFLETPPQYIQQTQAFPLQQEKVIQETVTKTTTNKAEGKRLF